MRPAFRIIKSYFHTPAQTARNIFVTVLRAGHLRAGPAYRVERRTCAGHDVLLCLKGKGYVQTGGRTRSVAPGQLAWLEGHHPHAHWADPERPWELLWARLDGHALDETAEALEIPKAPVFELPRPAEVSRVFRNILHDLYRSLPAVDALLNAEVARLIAFLFDARQGGCSRSAGNDQKLPAALQRTIDDLTVYYYRRWTIAELAQIAGMSVPHFYRVFRQATGSSPIGYLKLERISQAKRRLIASPDSVKEIAEQVGYADQFYFSRDFKRYTGMPPSQFRERAAAGIHSGEA